MKKVLVLAEFGTCNGGENSLLAVLPELIPRGWQFDLALPCPSELSKALDPLPIGLVPINFFGADERRKPLPQIRRELSDIIWSVSPDLIHANSLNMGRMLGPVVTQLGIPAVSHLRDIIKLNRTAVADLNRFDRLIAVSNATARFHELQGLDRERLQVVYNGINLEQFRPRPNDGQLRRKIGARENDLVALSIGQIGIRKGWDVLLESARSVLPEWDHLHFVIAGERLSEKTESIRFEQELSRLAQQPPLKGNVHFVGKLDRIDLVMSGADFLVHPARQEPLGRVLLEAMACGLPVIATDVGGTREIFGTDDYEAAGDSSGAGPAHPDHQALLIPPDSPELLAQAIHRFAGDHRFRQQLGQSSRKLAERRFGLENAVKSLNDVYHRALNHPQSADGNRFQVRDLGN